MKNLVVTKKKFFRTKLGQSMVEIVFSIGVIGLVVTGAVFLVTNSVGVKNRSFERKKAAEMSEVVVESLINQKLNNSSDFWNLSVISGETLPSFDGYNYSVDYNSEGLSCSDCTNAIIKINWGDEKVFETVRFFSKLVN